MFYELTLLIAKIMAFDIGLRSVARSLFSLNGGLGENIKQFIRLMNKQTKKGQPEKKIILKTKHLLYNTGVGLCIR